MSTRRRRLRCGAASLIPLVALLAVGACAHRDRVVLQVPIFGDSVTDNGRYFAYSNRTIPRPDVYYEGRFTNAPGMFQDYLNNSTAGSSDAKTVRIVTQNFAFGGATTCAYAGLGPQSNFILPIVEQVAQWARAQRRAAASNRTPGTRVHVVPLVWTGHPADFLVASRGQLSPQDTRDVAINTLRCLLNATRQLLAVRGVRTVVLATSASTAHMPVLLSWPNRTKAEEFARQLDLLNFGIRAATEAMTSVHKPRSQVLVWDAYTAMADVATRWRELGFARGGNESCVVYPPGVEGPALKGATPQSQCADPDAWVWFDNLHPSSRAYELITPGLQQVLLRQAARGTPTRRRRMLLRQRFS